MHIPIYRKPLVPVDNSVRGQSPPQVSGYSCTYTEHAGGWSLLPWSQQLVHIVVGASCVNELRRGSRQEGGGNIAAGQRSNRQVSRSSTVNQS